MTYACSYEVPASVEMYQEVRRRLGDDQPVGMVSHVVFKIDGGLRHIEVWESERAFSAFHDERVEPVVHELLRAAGFTEMPPDPPVEELDLVDVWLGSTEAA